MTQWEYTSYVHMAHSTRDIVEALNEYGSYGWELVGSLIWDNTDYIFYFKRPKNEELKTSRTII